MAWKCCVCDDSGWDDPQDVVWTDPADEKKGYCIFHAPAEQKGISDQEFQRLVFLRIDDVIEKKNGNQPNAMCVFYRAIFPGSITFSKYDENNPLPHISFLGAKFCNGVQFCDTAFSSDAIFTCATFVKRAIFINAKFHGKAWFGNATFRHVEELRGAEFFGAEFNGGASFRKTIFHGNALFSQATFCCKDVDFYNTEFHRFATFNEAKFNTLVRFQHVTFHGKSDFCGSNFSKAGNVHIEEMDDRSLKHLYFKLADLPIFTFETIHWPTRIGFDIYGESNVYNYQQCEELYRAMKKRADDEHDRRSVSAWHYREKLAGMKILLKVQKWLAALYNLIRLSCPLAVKAHSLPRFILYSIPVFLRCFFSLTFWYCLFSGFGEKVFRSGMWLVALLLLPFFMHSPAGEWLSSVLSPLWAAIPYSANIDTLAASIRDSVNATAAVGFIPFMKETTGPSAWLKVGQALWQGVIVLQFTLFALAVRNRFRR